MNTLESGVFDQCDRLRRIQAFVSESYTQPIDLSTAARVASMERSSFSRFFRQKVGLPFCQWLTRLRIIRARELLETEKHTSISDIAFAVGFSNLRSFQRSFKRYQGTTPVEHRKRKLGQLRAAGSPASSHEELR